MTRPADPGIVYGATCYRHSKRGTNVRCQNCGKPICSDCMRDTPVGHRCPECAPQSRAIFDESLIATKVLIAICFAVYFVEVVMELGKGQAASAVMTTTNNQLATNGWLTAFQVSQDHQWWRIVSSGFLHAGLFHIALNSFFIYSLGRLIEPAVGRWRFLLLYFVSLTGGAVGAMALSNALSPTIGASGAGFGLLGAALVMARLRRNEALAKQLMFLALINFAFTLTAPGISLGGHLGGFAAGAACGWILYGPFQRQRPTVYGMLAGLGVVLFAAALLVAHAKTAALVVGG